MENKNFWLIFISGLTAGAIVALLYAPQDGEATRKMIGKAYDDAEESIEDAGAYLKDQAERLSKESTHAYKKGMDQLDEAYAKATSSLNDAYTDAKDKLATAAESASDAATTVSKKARSLV